MSIWPSLAYVFCGGGLGAVSRYGLGLLVRQLGASSLWGTLLANALGAVFIGLLLGYELRPGAPTPYRLALIVGFCGGLTTFSTYTSELWQLLREARYLEALGYALVSNLFSLALLALAFWLLRR